ncbi:MAG: nucleoside hydrolase, partial [bacterium]|nr:nucleoside hydrolase [bacterium]
MLRRSFLHRASFLPVLLRAQNTRRRVILDADTANEIDDLYAIVRTLLEPGFDLRGLSSAQWRHHLSPVDTVRHSQRINEDILRLMDRQELPAPIGASMIMGKPWGGDEPRDTAAAQLMIREARAMPAGAKLTIASIGAVTNVASAIKLAPDIIGKVACYCLGGHFDPDRRVWNKDEFNFRRDLNAVNFLFNTPGLELHVMPGNVSRQLRFDLDDTLKRLQGKGGVWDYLAARWLSFSPSSKSWIMWDIALIEALAKPELAEEAQFLTPPENKQREIFVYTAIDAERMKVDWWHVADAPSKNTRSVRAADVARA